MVLRIRALLTALYAYQVQYVVFGSLGAIAYGANILTGDLDMCPATDPQNLRRLARCLTAIDARPDYDPPHNHIDDVMAWSVEPYTVENLDHRYMTKFGQLDVQALPYGAMGKHDRVNYEILTTRSVTFNFFDVAVQVAHIDDIVASKMSRKRAKDLRVESELRRVQGLAHKGIIISNLEHYDTMVKPILMQTEL